MHIVKAYQTLSSKFPYKGKRDSFVVITLDNLKEIYSKDLKDHNKVLSIWPIVDKGI